MAENGIFGISAGIFKHRAVPTQPLTASSSSSSLYIPGLHQLSLADPTLSSVGPTSRQHPPGRFPILAVPPRPNPEKLLLYFHGAGGDAIGGVRMLQGYTDEQNVLLLCPASHSSTWDAIRTGFGRDVTMIDTALANVLRVFPSVTSMAISGFSDGASYALSCGLANGNLFDAIIAWSPGFYVPSPAPATGRVKAVYLSHGKADAVLNVDRCSRRLVPILQGRGYHVYYYEFSGPHTVPNKAITDGMQQWFQVAPLRMDAATDKVETTSSSSSSSTAASSTPSSSSSQRGRE